MTRTDHCQDCKGGRLVPALGCACDGDGDGAYLYTYDLCAWAAACPMRARSDGDQRSIAVSPVQQRPFTATGLHFH